MDMYVCVIYTNMIIQYMSTKHKYSERYTDYFKPINYIAVAPKE